MWIGVGINFMAMCIVSAPAFMQPLEVGDRDPRLGILFIVLSCIVQGSQYVFEEKVMEAFDVPPLVVVGMEGFWGCIMILCLWPICYMIPGTDKGSLENMSDALVMLRNSSFITTLCGVFFVSVSLYNVFAVYVTFFLNSIWHAILDNFRPVSVWATDLALYYLITSGLFGESWRYPASYLQLFGMLVLFFGTAVYNGSIDWLFWGKVEKDSEDDDLESEELLKRESDPKRKTSMIRTPSSMASPHLTRSPLLQARKPRSNSSSINVDYGATK